MEIQAFKSELVKHILATESKDLLDKFWATLKLEEKDFWLEFTDAQKPEVEIGLKQIENEETEDWDDFFRRNSWEFAYRDLTDDSIFIVTLFDNRQIYNNIGPGRK
jgi:hypothetical protein